MPSRAELVRLLNAAPSLSASPRDVVVCERRPVDFMRAFAGAVAAGGRVFVADPDWDAARRARFDELVAGASEAPSAGLTPDAGWLCLPTGGSGGGVKLARHDAATLTAAAGGFACHFGVTRVNALGLLPLHHVSGFMAWMRSLLTGGAHQCADWSEIAAGRRPELGASDGAGWFVSLVPTQLARLLADPGAAAWLRGFRAVLLGGGPAWPELLEQAAGERLPIAFSYGSTETGAMVAALRPAEFLAGRRDSGAPLPHVRLSLAADARLQVEADSLFRGYWPGWRASGPWLTDDRAQLDAEGRLTVLGRADAFIITGGKKVDPAVVEAVLRSAGRWVDVAVIGLPDPDWGQRVVVCHTAEPGPSPDVDLDSLLRERLLPAERPKAFVVVAPWPRDAKGKVDRVALAAVAARAGRGC